MDPKDFCRWLQGVFDISKIEELNEEQIAMIRVHLNTVFEDKTGGGTAGLLKKEDPHHKENLWKVDPKIKTVLTC
jgi:hypothetical protein